MKQGFILGGAQGKLLPKILHFPPPLSDVMNLDLIPFSHNIHAGYNTTQPIAHPQESYLAHGTTPQASPEIPAVLSKCVLQ